MFTFLPVIHHELAPTFSAPLIQEEAAPVAPPSWPAPPREQEIVHETRFCVVRVAKGFSKKGFAPAPKSASAQPKSVVNAPAVFFEPEAPSLWAAPPRPAEVALKLPRRTAARQAPVRRTDDVTSLPC